MRRIAVISMGCLLVAASIALAGNKDKDPVAMMKNCSVCSPMAAHYETLSPSMEHAVIKMDDGMAMYTWITDASKTEVYHSVCDQIHENGAASADLAPDQVSKKLCGFCQSIHGIMSAGASMSQGKSANGSLMVLQSDDPEVQGKIAAFAAMAENMGT